MSLEYYQPTLDDSYDGQVQLIKYHERLEKLKKLNDEKASVKPTLEDILKRHGIIRDTNKHLATN